MGWEDSIAAFVDGAWTRFEPRTGWRAWIADEELLVAWTGSQWQVPAGGEATFTSVGIGTSADTENRLAVKADAAVFSHDDVTPGTGDFRATINKAMAGNDAGFVFQTDWSTRALFGLLGNEDLEIKTSPDGSNFLTSIKAASADGKVKIGGNPFMNFAALNIQGRALTGTGNSWYGVCVTNNNTNNASKGGMVLIGAPYTNAHLPMSMLAAWATASVSYMYYGGGAWGVSDVTQHRFYSTAHAPNTANTGTLALTVDNTAIEAYRNLRPSADNTYSLGTSGLRFSVVYAATGTINTSDARLKDIEGAVPLGLDFVAVLEPVAYKWKTGGHDIIQQWMDDPEGKTDDSGNPMRVMVDLPVAKLGSRTHFGLIAQQVKEQLDAFGIDDFAGWTLADKDDPDSEQGLRYDQFVPILIKAVQELSAKNAALEERIAILGT